MPIVSKGKVIAYEFGLLYAAAIWGATFFIVKEALVAIDPLVLVGHRFTIAAAVLAVVLPLTGRSLIRQWRQGVVLGLMLWFIYAPQTVGLKFTTASNSGFITGLFVVFVPLLAFLLFRRRVSIRELLALGLAFTGLWFLTGGVDAINLGDLMTLITAAAYALHILYVDRYVRSDIDPYVLSFQQFVIVAVLSYVIALASGSPLSWSSAGTGGVIIFLALMPTLSAFVIQLAAQRYVSPIRVSLIFTLEPVFAAAFAWTVGGEEFILTRAFGGLLIFFGMIAAHLGAARAKPGGSPPISPHAQAPKIEH